MVTEELSRVKSRNEKCTGRTGSDAKQVYNIGRKGGAYHE